MEAVQFKSKLGEAHWLHAAEYGEGLGTGLSGNLYDEGAVTAEYTENQCVLNTRLLGLMEGQEQNGELPEFGWMEAPMDLELFEQALSPLFDDSFLVEPSIPETLPYNQVNELDVKPDEHLYDTLELMLKQLQNEGVESCSPSPVYPTSMSDASTDSMRLLDVVDDGDAAEDIASNLLDALMQGKMEEKPALIQLADIAFEWADCNITSEAPEVPFSPEEPLQSPSCSGSSGATDTESSLFSEWEETPKKPTRLSGSSRSAKSSDPPAVAPKATGGRGRRSRIRPEERLLRKKEQNKTAATRYREKKKIEMGIVHEQEMELEKQNRKLQKEHDSLVQELRFMKKLIRDVFHKQSSSS